MIVSLFRWDTPYVPAVEEFLGEKIIECRTRAAALQALPEADVILTSGGAELLDEELVSAAGKLRLVLSVSAGVEKLPLKALHMRDVAVCNARGVYSSTIAEYVLGGLLAWTHSFPAYIRNQAAARWQITFSGDGLEGKTLLIIGAGSIGTEIARKARAFDMTVIGLRRNPAPAEFFHEVLGVGALRETLPRADFVVLATPLTPETRYLMCAEEFRRMKVSAVFVNIARGDVCDEGALIAALREKQIAGAVLDVFHTEPLPPDSPLWSMGNVLITPHSSGLSAVSQRKTILFLCDNLERYRQGHPLINRIEKGAMY